MTTDPSPVTAWAARPAVADPAPVRPAPTRLERLAALAAVWLFWRRYRMQYTGRRLANQQNPDDRAADNWSPLDEDVRWRLSPTYHADRPTTDLRSSARKAVGR